jgi:two-component system chemotaxis response regulator CheB
MSYKGIIIGGSAGSFQVVTKILASLPANFQYPVFLCLHRLKHVRSGFIEALEIKSKLPIVEPEDKTIIKKGVVYLAPSNYHMYIDYGQRFALSTEPSVNYSRPSIDLSFFSASTSFREKLVGIILSGANKDGAKGIKSVKRLGGLTIVQDPKEAQIKTMPNSALDLIEPDYVLTTDKISKLLNQLNELNEKL